MSTFILHPGLQPHEINRPKTQQVVKLKLCWVLFPGLAEVLVIDLGKSSQTISNPSLQTSHCSPPVLDEFNHRPVEPGALASQQAASANRTSQLTPKQRGKCLAALMRPRILHTTLPAFCHRVKDGANAARVGRRCNLRPFEGSLPELRVLSVHFF